MPVGADWYGVPMEQVREVVAAPVVQPLPTAPSSVRGVFNLHGDIVPLFDTAALLGLGRLDAVPFGVVVATASGTAALAASGPPRAQSLAEAMGAAETRGCVTRHACDGLVVVLLDVDAVLAPAHIGAPA